MPCCKWFFGALALWGPLSWMMGFAAIPTDFYRSTRDVPILQALAHLSQSTARGSVDHIVNRQVRILFKDMRELGKTYHNHDALTIITDNNEQMIFINAKHATAPPQALAALISHEVLHADRENSMQEETTAWNREGQTWQEMLAKFPELKQIRPGTFSLVDRENAIVVLQTQHRLHTEIQSNVAYQGLPAHSPGF